MESLLDNTGNLVIRIRDNGTGIDENRGAHMLSGTHHERTKRIYSKSYRL